LSSPPYRAARRIESAIEGRIVGALEAGERLSRASAVTVVIDAEAKEAFDDALDDADLEFEYREKEVDFSVEDYINFAGERSLIHFFAPDADDDDDMPPSVSQ
jgi:hypothetical protein